MIKLHLTTRNGVVSYDFDLKHKYTILNESTSTINTAFCDCAKRVNTCNIKTFPFTVIEFKFLASLPDLTFEMFKNLIEENVIYVIEEEFMLLLSPNLKPFLCRLLTELNCYFIIFSRAPLNGLNKEETEICDMYLENSAVHLRAMGGKKC